MNKVTITRKQADVLKHELSRTFSAHQAKRFDMILGVVDSLVEPEKPEGPRVTVLTFDRTGKQGSYSFHGKPDWERIEREMGEDGLLAVIVNDPLFDGSPRNIRISAKCLQLEDGCVRYTRAMPFSKKVDVWIWLGQEKREKKVIREAIAAYNAANAKPLHVASESFNDEYEYTGEERVPVDEPFVGWGNSVYLTGPDMADNNGVRWILRRQYLDMHRQYLTMLTK